MLNRIEINKEQALKAINSGEFPQEIIGSTEKVVIIMTQEWCPQWNNLKSWVYSFNTDEEINVFELIYDKVDYYNEFMVFKETKLGNNQIPYLRFYKEGKLAGESNYVNKDGFKNLLGI